MDLYQKKDTLPKCDAATPEGSNISLTVILFALILTQKVGNTLTNILMQKNPENNAKCTCWRVMACAGLCWLVLVWPEHEINKHFNRVTMLKFFWFRILWWRRGVYLRWGLFSRSPCVALPLSGVRDVWWGWGNSGPCSSDLWEGPHHCYNGLLRYWVFLIVNYSLRTVEWHMA